MAGSVNKVILVGNVGKDPEIVTAQSGKKIVKFSVATSESWRDKTSGERKEQTEWHNIVVFNDNLAEVAEKYVAKGKKVYLEGKQRTRKWEKDGVTRWTTETVLDNFHCVLTVLTPRGDGDRYVPSEEDYGNTTTRETSEAPQRDKTMDDEIPF
jgi:single-strand DNA-binding protein